MKGLIILLISVFVIQFSAKSQYSVSVSAEGTNNITLEVIVNISGLIKSNCQMNISYSYSYTFYKDGIEMTGKTPKIYTLQGEFYTPEENSFFEINNDISNSSGTSSTFTFNNPNNCNDITLEDLNLGTASFLIEFSEFSGTIEGDITTQDPLPVELLSFDAKSSLSGVEIAWATASETNNSHFKVERSSNGKNWSGIHTEEGAGNSSTQNFYSYIDRNPSNGISYYRLTQVDFDGKSKTYVPLSIQFEYGKKTRVYPNPAQSQITIESVVAEQNLQFYDMIGNEVTSQVSASKVGPQKITAQVSELQPGVYFVQLLGEKIQFVKQ